MQPSLSPRIAQLSSLLVFLLHAVYCGNYSYEALQYVTQLQVDGQIQNYVYRLLGLGALAPWGISCALAVTSAFTSAWHAMGMLRAVRASLRYRRFLLDMPEENLMRRLKATVKGFKGAPVSDSNNDDRPPSRYRRWFSRLGDLWRDYLTMDGAHFETGTNVRKSLEIATQIAVLLRMSRTITEREINHLVVAVFTLNCWSTSFIRWRFRHGGRLYRHIVNMVLASVFTVAVPCTIWVYVMPLVTVAALRFDQLASTRVRLLLRHIMISEWTQVVSTRVAACMAILAIEALKKTLATAAARRPAATVIAATENTDEQTTVPSQVRRRARPRVRIGVVCDATWFVIGVVVLGLHIQAQTAPPVVPGIQCHMPLRPWADPKIACAVVEVNCHRGAIRGARKEIDALLARMDPLRVSALRVTHCPSLTMPVRLQTLADLAVLEVYNSTVDSWDAEAALTLRHHPFLGSLWLLRVSGISSLPAGLLDPQFPAADILISYTDLASLPDDLADRWPRDLSKLVVEHSRLSVFPRAFADMSGYATSLAGNDIASIPATAFCGRPLMAFFSLGENPRLAVYPEDAPWFVSILDVRKTNVSAPARWATARSVGAAGALLVLGGRSRVCVADAPPTVLPSGLVIDCSPPFANRDGVTGLVPIDDLALERVP